MNNFSTIIYLVAAVPVVLLVVSVYLFLQMKNMRDKLNDFSYKLYFELTRKSDIIPLFIDKLRSHDLEYGFEDIISLRQQTVKLTKLGKRKKDIETSLWKTFLGVWDDAKKTAVVKNDHYLLSLETDLEEADGRISEFLETYNNYVKKYNALVGNFILKPIALLAKSSKAELF